MHSGSFVIVECFVSLHMSSFPKRSVLLSSELKGKYEKRERKCDGGRDGETRH